MIVIDTNALIIIIIGLIDEDLIKHHKRTSIYEKEDYRNLLSVIPDLNALVVLPNVWTEVDNLLNTFSGTRKDVYVSKLTEAIKTTSEKYVPSDVAAGNPTFYDLGVTDSLLLEVAQKSELLITSDSKLSDYAIASGIRVYDVVKIRNERITRCNS